MKFDIALKVKAKNGVLQKFIDDMNWTQSDLARKLNISPVTIGRYFNLQDFPRTEETMQKITSLLKMVPEDIFPQIIREPDFMEKSKTWTIYKEVDIEYLAFNKLPEIAYEPEMDGFDMMAKINEALDTLTPREAKVLRLRFGLEDGKELNLEETGRELDISKERIRQIEAKAFRKLKHPSRALLLEAYK